MAATSTWTGAASKVQYPVILGVWTDWSRGRVMGLTLTLRRTEGSLLIAFTAFFIGLVASSFWRILRFILHRYYSTPQPRDAVHHQRQALLRNTVTIPASLWGFLQLSWTWRHARQTWFRTLPIIFCAILSIAAFTVAGGFSSALSTAIGNAVLINGTRCTRLPTGVVANEIKFVHPLNQYWGKYSSDVANYAQQCYSASSSNMFDCTTYVKQHLPSISDSEAPCPFKNGICRSNSSNLMLDTGYIDSHEHLGINSKPEDRIRFRHVIHCAPLETSGYSSEFTTRYVNYTRYYYGDHLDARPRFNFTWQVESLSSQYDRQVENPFARNSPATTLMLRAIPQIVYKGNTYMPTSPFDPRPELARSDGDFTVIFLSGNGILFTEPNSDPWYRGFVPGTRFPYTADRTTMMTMYRPEEAASPMGCVRQMQFCNGTGHCGPLASAHDASVAAGPLFNSTRQQIRGDSFRVLPGTRLQDRYIWFVSAIIQAVGQFVNTINHFQGLSLQSQDQLFFGNMKKLPDNQWKIDVTHWWATMLSSVQAYFVTIAAGPVEPGLEEIAARTTPHIRDMCNNQDPYAFLEWTTNETLQLQRAAYQGIQPGTWKGYTDAVPKTQDDEILPDLTRTYAGAYYDEKRLLIQLLLTKAAYREGQNT
ncbi:hypothetical protein CP533_6797 [Ophiocordyceps camponoti-saundersi (nom. inval.)]|nr:hypothetical protein CP533_6797 [Ophiocordyceps camponoti-saundersi (nom. inval.)]